jgi:hypothetical protein
MIKNMNLFSFLFPKVFLSEEAAQFIYEGVLYTHNEELMSIFLK